MRLPFMGALLVCATASTVTAHHSASSWTAFYRNRYLLCAEAPVTRVQCLGPVRAKARMLADLAAWSTNEEAARTAAIEATYWNVTDAIPSIRKWLDHGTPALRAEAAFALANLGDKQATDKLAEMVADFETTGHGTLWEDALAALAIVDPSRASRYAIDFIAGQSDWRTSMPGGSSPLLALDYIRVEHRGDAVPILEKLAKREETGYDHAHCLLMAARVRLDDKLHADVRKQFLGHYSGTWLAGCANDVIGQLGDPDDAAALVRHLGRDDNGMDHGVANISYRRILEMLATHRPLAAKVRETLREGLAERSKWPHVADPSHANYSRHFVAFHAAALAGLGDTAARSALYELVDGDDREGSAWIAAYWSLRLNLPGAADHVASLATRSLTFTNEGRGDVFRDIRSKTLDAFADHFPADARWTIQLLDPDRDAGERALFRFSRTPPANACAVVTDAARVATPEGVEHALLALTSQGAKCLPQIEQLFLDTTVHGEIRGAALEFAAVLESPRICDYIARARAEAVWRPAIERAALLATCTASPPRRVDQPLPPRVHRQGL